ncbi:MAG: divergent PAP2 family protein [Anaerolineales bacterium]|nr:divergent PAP2 family protein [Anaerolineales bacterium]
MNPLDVFQNQVLIGALVAWSGAQILKLPVAYARTRSWNWSLLLRAGGMPSSHSALVTAAAHGIGLTSGFDTPLFAASVALAVIVIYDATGIRRQAGQHATIINAIIKDFFEGHPARSQEKLREVLGHSPLEAFIGTVLGIAVAQIVHRLWALP